MKSSIAIFYKALSIFAGRTASFAVCFPFGRFRAGCAKPLDP